MVLMLRRMDGVVRHSPSLVFREDGVVQLIKRSKLFLVNEIELSEVSSSL